MAMRRRLAAWVAMGLLMSVGIDLAPAVAGSGTEPGDVSYFLEVSRPPPVCAGQEVEVDVIVKRNVIPSAGPQPGSTIGILTDVLEVPITGTVEDPSIVGPETITEFSDVRAGYEGYAHFTFTAEKAGETTITFRANLGGIDLPEGSPVPPIKGVVRHILVRACHFKIHTNSSWDFPESHLGVSAIIDGADLRSDDLGKDFVGTANVTWHSGAIVGPGCVVTETIDNSLAFLTGKLESNTRLTVVITFDQATVHNHIVCPKDDHIAGIVIKPEPVTLVGSAYTFVIDKGTHAIDGVGQTKIGALQYAIESVKN